MKYWDAKVRKKTSLQLLHDSAPLFPAQPAGSSTMRPAKSARKVKYQLWLSGPKSTVLMQILTDSLPDCVDRLFAGPETAAELQALIDDGHIDAAQSYLCRTWEGAAADGDAEFEALACIHSLQMRSIDVIDIFDAACVLASML